MTLGGYAATMRILLQHVPRRRYRQLAALTVLTVASSVAELLTISAALPFLAVLAAPEQLLGRPQVRALADFLGATEPRNLLALLCLAFSVAILVAGLLRLALLWVQTRLSHLIGIDLAVDMLERTLHQPYRVHAARNSSLSITVINAKSMRLVTGFILPLLQILSAVTLMALVLAALIGLVPGVALFLLAGLLLVYGITAMVLRGPIARNGAVIAREMPRGLQALQEGLGGIRDILLDGSQKLHVARFARALRLQRMAAAANSVMATAPRYLVETVGVLLIVAIAYVMATRAEGLRTALPILGAVAFAAQRLLPVTQLAYNSWSQIRGAQAVLAECLAYLEQPVPQRTGAVPRPLTFRDEIRLDGVSLRYDGAGRPALEDVDLRIPRGTRLGIVGATGSGKSTLADLLMGLLVPETGDLMVDGVTVDAANRRAWQQHIAHVPQAIFLTDASLAENIAFGEEPERIDHNRLRTVIEQAQLASTVAALPEGLETRIGEGGVRLSGGQRQRIAIARALYREADVIVFDEATSALDSATETRVMQAVAGLDRSLTLVIVAHRLTTLKGCDRIVEIGAGRIMREGTPADMLDTTS